MKNIKSIEVAGQGFIKVNGVIGQTVFSAVAECIQLANLLSVAVELFWNGRTVMVYKNSEAQEVINQATINN